MSFNSQKQFPHKNRKSRAHQADLNIRLATIKANYDAMLHNRQFNEAIKFAQQALKLMPNHPKVLGDLALAYLRAGLFDKAYVSYHKAIKATQGIDTNLYDGLTETCGHLGKSDEVKHNGCIALNSKLVQVKNKPLLAIPQHTPPDLSSDRSRNVIVFSLFGANPRYCENAIVNINVAKELFPEWICRFYCDESVPQEVRHRLDKEGGQVMLVPDSLKNNTSGLMWRFWVLDDPTVDRFLCRDADSLLSTREQYAVREWIDSQKWFHVMRDYFTHTELMLAGMWGGCNGVFNDLPQMIERFIISGEFLAQRVIDQHFLRHMIWPTVQQSLHHHDSVFGFAGSHPFPEHPQRFNHEKHSRFHVGANVGEVHVVENSQHADGTVVYWSVMDQGQKIVCSYPATVKDAKIQFVIPRTYAEQVINNEWGILIDGKMIEQVINALST